VDKRAFISVDVEGLPHIVSGIHLSTTKRLFNEARSIATEITIHVAKVLHEHGFARVIVADSHGEMLMIDPFKIPRYVDLVRGFPRPMAMISGAEGCDIAIFLGYHARAGREKATFSHTFTAAFREVKVNNIAVSEYLFNTYLLGEMGIPVVLVAGDRPLIDEVNKFTPWAIGVTLKESYTYYSAKSSSLDEIKEILTKSVKEAIDKFEKGLVKPLRPRTPIDLEIAFTSTIYADIAELLPNVRRVSGDTITYTAKSMREACKVLELLIYATLGVRYLITR